MYLLKMSGPQIWLCLFTFASKKLNGLTTIDSMATGARGPGFNPHLHTYQLKSFDAIVASLLFSDNRTCMSSTGMRGSSMGSIRKRSSIGPQTIAVNVGIKLKQTNTIYLNIFVGTNEIFMFFRKTDISSIK